MNGRRTFMPHGLQIQEPERVQSSLFALEPRTEEPECKHAGDREVQPSLIEGYDLVCCICGETIEHSDE